RWASARLTDLCGLPLVVVRVVIGEPPVSAEGSDRGWAPFLGCGTSPNGWVGKHTPARPRTGQRNPDSPARGSSPGRFGVRHVGVGVRGQVEPPGCDQGEATGDVLARPGVLEPLAAAAVVLAAAVTEHEVLPLDLPPGPAGSARVAGCEPPAL